MLSQGQDVIVIGGGVIGLAVAYFAARAGLQVTVIEAAKIGGQGSSVAAGLIAPASQITGDTPFARLALASLALVPELRDQLFRRNRDRYSARPARQLARLDDQRRRTGTTRLIARKTALRLKSALAFGT
jgi:glycine/D-amino acid oxidase-like deaminating enzyme